jgi:membrane protease YdiL (CAAX protease family)/RNA polymerase subunit RPABC4/transcription elongation factor Spt4
MSKENNSESKIKYCVHCGAKVGENETYCPKCGKLVVKLSDAKSEITPSKLKTSKITRTCSGCGSIITSPILEQCPICNTILEKVPKDLRSEASETLQKSSGVIFSNKKLIPEKALTLKKDSWNLKEGLNVFVNALVWYVMIRFLIIILLTFQGETVPVDISTILLSQIPDLIFAVYPIWYIYAKKHKFSKLGFNFKRNKVLYAFFLGVVGAVILLFTDILSNYIIEFMYSIGINFVNVDTYIAQEHAVIQDANLIWLILLISLLVIGSISSEIIYRGVLHNTLREYFQDKIISRIYVILIVALIYSAIYLLFSLPIGLYFFVTNFIVFIILGIIYEINGNILNTIIVNAIYNITLVLIIYFNVSLF